MLVSRGRLALAAAVLHLLEPERAELTETDRLAEVGKLAGHLAAGTVALRVERLPHTARQIHVFMRVTEEDFHGKSLLEPQMDQPP